MRAAGSLRCCGPRRHPQGAMLRRAAGYCGTVGEFREVVLPWAARELAEGCGAPVVFREVRSAAFFDFPMREGRRDRLLRSLRRKRGAGGRQES